MPLRSGDAAALALRLRLATVLQVAKRAAAVRVLAATWRQRAVGVGQRLVSVVFKKRKETEERERTLLKRKRRVARVRMALLRHLVLRLARLGLVKQTQAIGCDKNR